MLLARLYESTPLVCPICKIEGDSVRYILEYIGESADPPRASPARGPPAWEEEANSLPQYDSVAQSESDFQFSQTIGW